MGCDGGSLPCRKDLVKTTTTTTLARTNEDAEAIRVAKFSNCPISSTSLCPPFALLKRQCHDELALCNREALLSRLLEGQFYPRKLKLGRDFIYTNTTWPIICPLSGKEFNERLLFRACWTCGCIVAEEALVEYRSNFKTDYQCLCGAKDGRLMLITQNVQ